MAAAKKVKKQSDSRRVSYLLRKPETMIGLVLFLIAGAVLLQAFNRNTSTALEVLVSPVPMAVLGEQSPIAEPAAAATNQPGVATIDSLENVNVLANTSSSMTVIAREGDTFWKLARIHCGSGTAAAVLKKANGYALKHLQPGDKISVVCE